MGANEFFGNGTAIDIDDELLELLNKLRAATEHAGDSIKKGNCRNSGAGLRKIERYNEEKTLRDLLEDEFSPLPE